MSTPIETSDPLVSCAWLNSHLNGDKIKIIDASWRMPDSAGLSAHDAYLDRHIPGAVFFDIEAIADRQTSLPNMAPSATDFADAVSKLGISNACHVIVYDDQGIFSAPRVWWTFRAMGHNLVSVLDGGLPAWQRARLRVENGPAKPRAPESQSDFHASLQPGLFVDADTVKDRLSTNKPVLDARPAARFLGHADEPRPNLRRGHMPGAVNLPFCDLLNADNHLKDKATLEKMFSALGIDNSEQSAIAITTCGSGISAAIINLALAATGLAPGGLYDGSWAEWGAMD